MNPVDGGDLAWCACGSAWFELWPEYPATEGPVEVVPTGLCLNRSGDVTGFSGKMHCIECGAPWPPPAADLARIT